LRRHCLPIPSNKVTSPLLACDLHGEAVGVLAAKRVITLGRNPAI
jgi:hypothetical protein